ncbi:hypothetical protein L226DRAFT_611195 [Lentinus tigrinus ALCF2SS1-7]|uniref:Uncharacterized protein n=1 Tax=Lentinus tigrinus ALCF2SS1-6 TaxID=1328759 RepID=A0A5C2RVL4_9APHY|nr:hypothetical protein L227DRAFT_603916 [Lentinus tigrinus ALCF2SS1-6]RPD76751.1 hypothetical protein L226DRAFT_611195 [Lentinus tigrinus ALCF2SS1-7]
MYTLKPTALFRPSSRPTSPAPVPRQESPAPADRARPLSKLTLSNFRRPSPSPAATQAPPNSTVVQDGSFMEVLSLKLSEAVSKALAQPPGPGAPGELLAGRRPLPTGRGRTLGSLIVSEVKASKENTHLYRAVIRTLHRPLSVLQMNLSNMLIPLISSPAFHTPAAPTPQEPNLNATQLHAVALATFAGELLESFDEMRLGVDADTRGENLKTIRESLVSIVKRVVDPLLNGIKAELMPLIEGLETVPAPPAPSSTAGKTSGAIKSPVPHPSIMSLQTLIPIHARALSRIVASAYAESALASLVISLVWRGMVALSHRPSPVSSPPASPAAGTATLKPKDSKKSLTSPPGTPPPSRFTLKLPQSRPPSPPSPAAPRGPTVAADARALYNLFALLPRPSGDKAQTRLAREVVDEAFDGLSALIALLESIQVHSPAAATAAAASAVMVRSSSSASASAPLSGATYNNTYHNNTTNVGASPKVTPVAELEADLDLLTADIPIVVALPLLLRTYVPSARSVPAILGYAEAEYRKECLSGFGRAEECGLAVGERVLKVLRGQQGQEGQGAQGAQGQMGGEAEREVVLRWLEKEVEAAREERAGEGDGDGDGDGDVNANAEGEIRH